MAVQLAQLGHDVWISSSRGRPFSRTHVSLSPDDELTRDQYWDYSYEEIGIDEIPAFADAIIAARPGNCNKVTVVPHSSAVNSAIIAAAQVPGLSTKVGSVVGLAPCLQLNLDNLFVPLRDLASIEAVYSFLASVKITNLFGPNHLDAIAPLCNSPGLGENLCNLFFVPNPADDDPYLREISLKAYAHIHQNSVQTSFEPYVAPGGSFT